MRELVPETRSRNTLLGYFAILVQTGKLAPATRSRNRFASAMEQNPGAKILLRNNFFRMKSLVHTRELCPRNILRENVSGASSLVCTGLKTAGRIIGTVHAIKARNDYLFFL